MRFLYSHTLKFVLFFGVLTLLPVISAATPPLPQLGTTPHLGVATCSGSTCHGAAQPFDNSTVLQNEFITWQREDAHAKAYQVLLNDDSKRIARNLGLKSAHTAKRCLDCHADNVAEDLRGKRFQIADGVGCEACHGGAGGAQGYLGLHVSGQATHAENVQNGLYPSEDPIARADLCLSCHFGNNDKFVTHKIMGAGHPRMSFELDTFTAIMPAHFTVDSDYKERKQVWSNTKVWAIGQTKMVQAYLKQLSRPERLNSGGLFPELVFFDCHACHHSMDNKRWGARASAPLDPGTVRLNDANFLILKEIIAVVDPALATQWQKNIVALHKAGSQGSGAIIKVAARLQQTSESMISKIAGYSFDSKTALSLLRRITDQGITGEYRDYAAAEQSLMAIDALLSTLESAGRIKVSGSSALGQQLDALYKVLEDDDTYRPDQYIGGLKKLKSLI